LIPSLESLLAERLNDLRLRLHLVLQLVGIPGFLQGVAGIPVRGNIAIRRLEKLKRC